MTPERLRVDQDRLRQLVASNPTLIKIDSAVGSPPTKYMLTLRCRGIGSVRAGAPVYREEHVVEILLGPGYPFDQPTVNFMTPMMHPHVWTNSRVCLGDWSITEFLDLLVVRLFRIVQYHEEVLDSSSVANMNAQLWLESNRALVPLGDKVPGEAPKRVEPPKPVITFRKTSP
jgi:hypothetical protein